MVILHTEHAVPDFDAWKTAFDRDPVGRERSGVRHHRILRPIDDPNFVTIELEFESREEAEAFLDQLRGLWRQVQGTVIENPQARILEAVERVDY